MPLPKDQPRLYHHRALDTIAWVSRLNWTSPETYRAEPIDRKWDMIWLSPEELRANWWEIERPYPDQERWARSIRPETRVQMANPECILKDRAVVVATVLGLEVIAVEVDTFSGAVRETVALTLRDDRGTEWIQSLFDFIPATPEAEESWRRYHLAVGVRA